MEYYGKASPRPQTHLKSVITGGSITIYCSSKVSYTGGLGPGNLRRPSFSWFYQLHRGKSLTEGATMRSVIWAWSACLTSCMTGSFDLIWLPSQRNTKCHLCLAFKARQPKAPLKNIMTMHPLELVHLDYLCLEAGKGQVHPDICNQDPNFLNDC